MCCCAFLSDESLFMWLNCDVIGSLTIGAWFLDSKLSTCCFCCADVSDLIWFECISLVYVLLKFFINVLIDWH